MFIVSDMQRKSRTGKWAGKSDPGDLPVQSRRKLFGRLKKNVKESTGPELLAFLAGTITLKRKIPRIFWI